MLSRATERRPVGRPATGTNPGRSVRLSDGMYEAIAAWQKKREKLGLKTTSECIRKLLNIALHSEGVIDKETSL